MKTVTRTERGWAAHCVVSDQCQFRRNTLLVCDQTKIVVSTIGDYWNDGQFNRIGAHHYYETLVFHAHPVPIHPANIHRPVTVLNTLNVETTLDKPNRWLEADVMHENIVSLITQFIEQDKL